MAISKEALEDLNSAFKEELQKIRKREEHQRKEAFKKMEFVDSPTLEEDRSSVYQDLLKKQEKNIEDKAKRLEAKMFEDYGGSYKAGIKHFSTAHEINSGEASGEFNDGAQPTAEQTKEQERAAFFSKTLNEFNSTSKDKSRDRDHGFDRD
ncbi:MAG: hypothetical protein R8G66_26110 [Cytophagales bacterium]|nr:hypothetical protein [Cytophagales bacterium]